MMSGRRHALLSAPFARRLMRESQFTTSLNPLELRFAPVLSRLFPVSREGNCLHPHGHELRPAG